MPPERNAKGKCITAFRNKQVKNKFSCTVTVDFKLCLVMQDAAENPP